MVVDHPRGTRHNYKASSAEFQEEGIQPTRALVRTCSGAQSWETPLVIYQQDKQIGSKGRKDS